MNLRKYGIGVVILVLFGMTKIVFSADGLYRLNEDNNGQLVQRGDIAEGGEIHLGDLISTEMREAALVSLANDNSQFGLTLKAGPIPKGAEQGHLLLVIGESYLPVSSHSDRAESGIVNIHTQVAGQDAALKIAKSLEIEPQLRKHPGHAILVTVKPKQNSYHPNEAVNLVMTIKNEDKTTVRFYDGGSQRGPRNNQFSFTAFSQYGFGHALPDVGDPQNFGGEAIVIKLLPGEVFTKEVLVTNWFKFAKPDQYQITSIYEMGLLDEKDQTIWNDFAIARCNLPIRALEAAKEAIKMMPQEEVPATTLPGKER